MDDEFAKGYEHYFKEEVDMKKNICENKNIVIIAGKPKEVYIYNIMEKFQIFDKIEIQVIDVLKEKAEFIIKFLEIMGIVPKEGYPIKFENIKQEIFKKNKREVYESYNRTFLVRIPDLCRFTYDNNKEIYNDKKVVVIGKMSKEIYTYTIAEKLHRFDQIEIQVMDAYLEKALEIIKFLEGMGILPEEGYPIKFNVKEKEITPKGASYTGNLPYKAIINSMVLTKIPSLYKYTHN